MYRYSWLLVAVTLHTTQTSERNKSPKSRASKREFLSAYAMCLSIAIMMVWWYVCECESWGKYRLKYDEDHHSHNMLGNISLFYIMVLQLDGDLVVGIHVEFGSFMKIYLYWVGCGFIFYKLELILSSKTTEDNELLTC